MKKMIRWNDYAGRSLPDHFFSNGGFAPDLQGTDQQASATEDGAETAD